MRKTTLSSGEIQDLINKYQSELKKLEFQTEEIVATIDGLKKWLASVESREKIVLAKVGKKKKSAAKISMEPAVKRKRGRPSKKVKKVAPGAKKEKAAKGYKLSDWDNWVISSIKDKGQPLITQEIIDTVKAKAQESGLSSSDKEVKNKVTRSLQKLANRRGDIMKVPYKGKGHAYAIPGMQVKKKITKRS